MLRILTVFVLTGMFFVNAQLDPACITDADKNTVNGAIGDLGVSLAALVVQGDTSAILDKVCNDQDTRASVDMIEMKIKACLPLMNVTSVKDLSIGPLGFKDLFERFESVKKFCGCVPSLVGLMTIEGLQNMILINDNDAAFASVINFPFVCNSSAAMLPPDYVKQTVVVIANSAKECPAVFHYGMLLKQNNIMQMKGLVDMCEDNVETDFNCAMNASKKETFKTCINEADTTTSDDAMKSKCKRNECSEKMDCSEAGTKYLRWSVEVRNPNKFDNKNDCSGAGSLTTTVLLVLAAALYSIFSAK